MSLKNDQLVFLREHDLGQKESTKKFFCKQINSLAKVTYGKQADCSEMTRSFQYLMQLSTFQIKSSKPLNSSSVLVLKPIDPVSTESCLQQHIQCAVQIDGHAYSTLYGNQDDEFTWNKEVVVDSAIFDEFIMQQPCEIVLNDMAQAQESIAKNIKLAVSKSEKFNSRLENSKCRQVLSSAALLGGKFLKNMDIFQGNIELIRFFKKHSLETKKFNFPCLPTSDQLDAILNQTKSQDKLNDHYSSTVDFVEFTSFSNFQLNFDRIMNRDTEQQTKSCLNVKQHTPQDNSKNMKKDCTKKDTKHLRKSDISNIPMDWQKSTIEQVPQSEALIPIITNHETQDQIQTAPINVMNLSEESTTLAEKAQIQSNQQSINLITDSEMTDAPKKSIRQLYQEKKLEQQRIKQQEEEKEILLQQSLPKRKSLLEKLQLAKSEQNLNISQLDYINLLDIINDLEALQTYSTIRDDLLKKISSFNFQSFMKLRNSISIQDFMQTMNLINQTQDLSLKEWQDIEYRRFLLKNKYLIEKEQNQIKKALRVFVILMYYIYFQESYELIYSAAHALQVTISLVDFDLPTFHNSYNKAVNFSLPFTIQNPQDCIYIIIGFLETPQIFDTVKKILEFHAIAQSIK
ncbi:hypothetical protein SS50377_28015 [Spironucleus salmonicida]|uniref:Uncharacterized protein n=1 Tax=Spironucleus salmonicida TaxID=348837 RepID=V6LDL3_9EUKA|nr:hypothetical protein SS50377_28015 [Spironucleus salmonicida]|eukprot:EST42572.1 Hypothetical protein SS50377_17888 [Spironucleus salmonicida]